MIPAWHIQTWNRVMLTEAEFVAAYSRFSQISSNIIDGGRGSPRCGQALWGTSVPSSNGDRDIIGIAWDWAEVRTGTVALVDPMRLLTNVQLVREDGICCDDVTMALHLNTAVHGMNWQKSLPL